MTEEERPVTVLKGYRELVPDLNVSLVEINSDEETSLFSASKVRNQKNSEVEKFMS